MSVLQAAWWSQSDENGHTARFHRLFLVLFCFGLISAIWTQDRTLIVIFTAAVLALGCAKIIRGVSALTFRNETSRKLAAFRLAYGDDLLPAALLDRKGRLTWENKAAKKLSEDSREKCNGLGGLLRQVVPNPSTAIKRLSENCRDQLTYSETLLGPDEGFVIHLRQIGSDQLWRFQKVDGFKARAEESTPMLTTGRNDTILFMNAAAKALVGERLMTLDRLFPSLPKQNGQQVIMTKRGPVPVEVKMQHLHGNRRHVFLTPIAEQSGERSFALTDLPVPLMRVSKEGIIEDANAPAASLLGVSTCVGNALGDVFESLGSQLEDWLTRSDLPNASQDAEFLRVNGASKETFVQVSLRQLSDEVDQGFVAVLTDATKLKSLEAQFVQSQKMQAIGQLAGGVAHDFNNLLTAISGHCDLMLLRHDPGDLDYSDLMQIHQNANRAAALVSQLLAFSRKQTLQPETLDLRDTLSDLTHLLNRLVGETVKLSLSHDPVLKPVRADKRQLEQVIMNLVVNARDAMPAGGEITVETESLSLNAALKRERVTVPAGEYVVVRVRDQGIGIEAAALEKIFEPFYTTKRTGEGTGLGLSTAYGIVKQTGGYIFADSEPGHGTCFSLLFPAAELETPPVVDPVSEEVPTAGDRGDGIVLLVEDEAPVRAFASRALQMRGFSVIEAESAEQALSLLEDPSLNVDVFVTDVVMPGMDGPSWVRQALEMRPETRVVFVSGYAEGAFKGKRPEVPNSVFLPKPFSLAELTSTVQKSMN